MIHNRWVSRPDGRRDDWDRSWQSIPAGRASCDLTKDHTSPAEALVRVDGRLVEIVIHAHHFIEADHRDLAQAVAHQPRARALKAASSRDVSGDEPSSRTVSHSSTFSLPMTDPPEGCPFPRTDRGPIRHGRSGDPSRLRNPVAVVSATRYAPAVEVPAHGEVVRVNRDDEAERALSVIRQVIQNTREDLVAHNWGRVWMVQAFSNLAACLAGGTSRAGGRSSGICSHCRGPRPVIVQLLRSRDQGVRSYVEWQIHGIWSSFIVFTRPGTGACNRTRPRRNCSRPCSP